MLPDFSFTIYQIRCNHLYRHGILSVFLFRMIFGFIKAINCFSKSETIDNMNIGKEFEKYAVKHKGISSNQLDSYTKHMVTNLTPNYHRRTSYEHCRNGRLQLFDDGPYYIPWVIPSPKKLVTSLRAQLLFRKVRIVRAISKCTLTAPRFRMRAWGCMIPCNISTRT